LILSSSLRGFISTDLIDEDFEERELLGISAVTNLRGDYFYSGC